MGLIREESAIITDNTLTGSPRYYRNVTFLLFGSFLVNGIALLVLNVQAVEVWISELFGVNRGYFVQLFFWGCAGATIASSVFLANDKEINELEALKERPDPKVLRYPNIVDVWLYLQRILSSGFLAVFGAAILIAGLGYFDAPYKNLTGKHRLFFVIFSLLIGLFENRFLASLEQLSKRMFKKTG